MNRLNRRWVLAGCIGLPFLVLIVMVGLFGVNVPYMDQWEFVSIFHKHVDGGLGFADFFAQHNEHRILFPRLVMFGLALVSHWNVVWEMVASVLLAGACSVLLYKIIARTLAGRRTTLLATFIISVILFSPIQSENWLWGWQIQWYLNLIGLIVAVWALSIWQRAPFYRVLVAAAGAALATYSLGSGFFVWLICLPFFWFVRPLRRWAWLWILVAVAAVGAHYIGYHDPNNSPARNLIIHEPIGFAKYVAVYLAHPLAPLASVSSIIAPLYAVGLGGILTYVWLKLRSELSGSLLPWLVLGSYACFAAVSTAVARLGLGVIQAYSSRYTTLSQLLLIMGIVIAFKLLEQKDVRDGAWQWVRPTLRVSLVVCGVLVALNYGKGALQMHKSYVYMKRVQQCAHTAASKDDPCLVMLYPSPGAVWPRLEFLRSQHYGGL